MTEIPFHLAHLTPASLTPLVRSALQNDHVQVDDWQVDSLSGGAGGTGGQDAGISHLYRLHGHALDGDERLSWQLILKSTLPAPGRTELSGDEREWQAYASGVLAALPGPLTTPRCLGAEKRPDGELWLWLEAIDDAVTDWPHAHYAKAAHQLGILNARFAQQQPDWPWLSRHWLRSWVRQRGVDVEKLRGLSGQHAQVDRAFPPAIAAATLALWDDHEALLSALEGLPQTFCHLDAFRRNMLTRRTPGGEEQLLLIDWSFAGAAALGEEMAPLIVASEMFEKAAAPNMPALEAAAYPAYLEGLRAGGWTGDPRVVRFAYCAASALRYGLPILMERYTDPGVMAWAAELFRAPAEVLLEQEPVWRRYLLGLADEARALLPAITQL
jgi:hypothetical protein